MAQAHLGLNRRAKAKALPAATFLMAQASLGLGQQQAARKLLKKVLQLDRSHAQAADLMEATL